jgi:hypothetical protein
MGTIHPLIPPPNSKAWAIKVLTEIVGMLGKVEPETRADVEARFRQRAAEGHRALAIMSRRRPAS